MRQPLAVVLMLAMLASGIESAIDLAVTSFDSAAHEPHQPHVAGAHDDHSDDQGVPHNPDSEQHAHVCHCGAHAPPLPFALHLNSIHSHDPTPAFRRALNAIVTAPPPLPPPIA